MDLFCFQYRGALNTLIVNVIVIVTLGQRSQEKSVALTVEVQEVGLNYIPDTSSRQLYKKNNLSNTPDPH